jgi:flagellar basal-body rod protein FlgC
MDILNTALSGMNAAATRVSVGANNIANAQSTTTTQNGQTVNQPYVAQQVQQTAQNTGGVSTSLRDVSPPSVPVFAPDNPAAGEDGIVQMPNVDLNMEVANQLLASNTYKANANVIKRADEMYQSLLDIQS